MDEVKYYNLMNFKFSHFNSLQIFLDRFMHIYDMNFFLKCSSVQSDSKTKLSIHESFQF